MVVKDVFHDLIVEALEKIDWTIINDLYSFSTGNVSFKKSWLYLGFKLLFYKKLIINHLTKKTTT